MGYLVVLPTAGKLSLEMICALINVCSVEHGKMFLPLVSFPWLFDCALCSLPVNNCLPTWRWPYLNCGVSVQLFEIFGKAGQGRNIKYFDLTRICLYHCPLFGGLKAAQLCHKPYDANS